MDCQKSADEIHDHIEKSYMTQQVKELVKGSVKNEYKSTKSKVIVKGDSQRSIISKEDSKNTSLS